MIPCSGFFAGVLGIVALFVAWERPIPGVWWCVLGLLIADMLFTGTVANSLKMYGPDDSATKTWGPICGLTQIALIGLSIYVIAF